jgi:hypothetical protein
MVDFGMCCFGITLQFCFWIVIDKSQKTEESIGLLVFVRARMTMAR